MGSSNYDQVLPGILTDICLFFYNLNILVLVLSPYGNRENVQFLFHVLMWIFYL